MTKCTHINCDNEQDCENEAEFMCKCCASPSCEEHSEWRCEFWWERFTEI